MFGDNVLFIVRVWMHHSVELLYWHTVNFKTQPRQSFLHPCQPDVSLGMVIALFFLGITAEQEQCATSLSNSCPHLFCWLHECLLNDKIMNRQLCLEDLLHCLQRPGQCWRQKRHWAFSDLWNDIKLARDIEFS